MCQNRTIDLLPAKLTVAGDNGKIYQFGMYEDATRKT